jgi:hypothetical protein
VSSVNILINVSNKHTYYLQLMIIYIDRYKVDQGHTRYEIILRNSPKREINNALIERGKIRIQFCKRFVHNFVNDCNVKMWDVDPKRAYHIQDYDPTSSCSISIVGCLHCHNIISHKKNLTYLQRDHHLIK